MQANQLTITEGPLAESSRPRAFSQSIGSPSKMMSPKKELRLPRSKLLQIHQAEPAQPQYTCRICLEDCDNVQFCMCSGGMLCHHQCLRQYLQTTDRTSGQQKCEVCKSPYGITYQRKCSCSREHARDRINARPVKCTLYALFFVLSIAVYAYLLKLLIKHQLRQDIVTVAIAVLACLTIMFFFFVIIWSCEFLVLNRNSVLEIKPLTEAYVQRVRKLSKLSTSNLQISMEDLN